MGHLVLFEDDHERNNAFGIQSEQQMSRPAAVGYLFVFIISLLSILENKTRRKLELIVFIM